MAATEYGNLQVVERASNRSTRDCWELYQTHRTQVTALLLDALARRRQGPVPLRLCILGAGNLNDVNLLALRRECHELVLVDIDEQAVAKGQERQLGAAPSEPHLHVVAPFDLSGLAAWADTRGVAPLSDAEVDDLSAKMARRLLEFAPESPGGSEGQSSTTGGDTPHGRLRSNDFDVVASTCVVSQLVKQVFDLFVGHRQMAYALARSVVRSHLDFMLQLLQEGGEGLLITDFAREAPRDDVKDVRRRSLSAAAVDWDGAATYAHLSPSSVAEMLIGEQFCRKVGNISSTTSWRWQLAPDVVHHCYAMRFRHWGTPLESDARVRLADHLKRFTMRTGVTIHALGSPASSSRPERGTAEP
jgi:hypothetical protein